MMNPLALQVTLVLMLGLMFYHKRTRFMALCLGAQLALLAVSLFTDVRP